MRAISLVATLTTFAAAAATGGKLRRISCHLNEDGAYFELGDLEKKDGDYSKDGVTWNFCAPVQWPAGAGKDPVTYAYLKKDDKVHALTNSFDPKELKVVNNGGKSGIQSSFVSNEDCTESKKYSYQYTVWCDASKTTAATSSDFRVTTGDCSASVAIDHAEGCADFDVQEIVGGVSQFISSYPYIFGVILLALSIPITLAGQKWLPYIVQLIVTIFIFLVILMICSAMDWMSTDVGLWVCICVDAVLSGVLGWLSLKLLKPAIAALGGLGGFLLGSSVYTMFLGQVSGMPAWTILATGILVGIICFILAWKYARMAVVLSTALIGSYLFMRGWSYLLGGYPNEGQIFADLSEGKKPDMTYAVLGYLVLWSVTWIAGIYFQYRYTEPHTSITETDDYDPIRDRYGGEWKRAVNTE